MKHYSMIPITKLTREEKKKKLKEKGEKKGTPSLYVHVVLENESLILRAHKIQPTPLRRREERKNRTTRDAGGKGGRNGKRHRKIQERG